eukprot:15248853-Heterocapsa_arctica.AAC.1
MLKRSREKPDAQRKGTKQPRAKEGREKEKAGERTRSAPAVRRRAARGRNAGGGVLCGWGTAFHRVLILAEPAGGSQGMRRRAADTSGPRLLP